MPVTTRHQIRAVFYLSAISEGGPSEDTFPGTMQESDDDDDAMDESFAVLSSGEGEEHESVWDEPESGASEGGSGREESEIYDDYEGTSNT